jgi:hypothetical protein
MTRTGAYYARGAGLVILLSLLCTACQTPQQAAKPSAAETLPPAPPLPAAGSTHYRIAAQDSKLRILVYRGGPLAQFGHNHVIAAHDLEGDVYLNPRFHASGFRFRIPVARFEVDPSAARQEEGKEFATRPSPEAVAGTRKNMLGPKVLDAKHYPEITVRSIAVNGPEWAPDITVRITLHGVSRDLVIPVALWQEGNRINVTGTTRLQLTEFGMKPFSVMGGGLRVKDGVKVRFHIIAVED